MGDYQGVFERYEKKYLLTPGQYRALRQEMEGRTEPDQYGRSTVCSVYFDTPSYRLIRRSLEKPGYKEKLRLRSYGEVRGDDPVFVELKKKYGGIVYKRRVQMTLDEAEAYLYRGQPVGNPSQITREIDWFCHFYGEVAPRMLITCERVALCGVRDEGLRVTFDRDIRWREEALSLREGVWGDPLLRPGERLMEIKAPGALPLWLADALSGQGVFPISFSKYGSAYCQKMGGSAPADDRHLKEKGASICA